MPLCSLPETYHCWLQTLPLYCFTRRPTSSQSVTTPLLAPNAPAVQESCSSPKAYELPDGNIITVGTKRVSVVMRILHVGKVCTLTLRSFWRSRAGCRMSPLLRLTGVLEVAIETVRSEIDIFVHQRVFSTLNLPSSMSTMMKCGWLCNVLVDQQGPPLLPQVSAGILLFWVKALRTLLMSPPTCC